MRAVFVDTGGWLALILQNDQHHEQAVAYYKQLRLQNMPLVTSDYVLDETYTRLRYDAGLQVALVAQDLIVEAESLDMLHIQWVDKKIAKESWDLFVKYQDQKISFTDCTSWAICKKLGIGEAFAFDWHFQLVGFSLPHKIDIKYY